MNTNLILSSISLDDLNNHLSIIIRAEIAKQITPLINNSHKEPEEYLSRNEIKTKLGVSLPTIHTWTKEGKLKGYRIGRLIRYKKSEIEACLIQINTGK